jgi:hypothetical protein
VSDENTTPPLQPRPAHHDVQLEERSIDVNTVVGAVSAVSSAISAGVAVHAARRPSASPPPDPPAPPQPKIELPPGVDGR